MSVNLTYSAKVEVVYKGKEFRLMEIHRNLTI